MLNALLRLGELSCRKVIVILIGEQGWDTFCSTARTTPHEGIYFPAYTKEEVRYILLRERPSDADETLYNGFLSFMLSTFHATCRNLHELRARWRRSGRSRQAVEEARAKGDPLPEPRALYAALNVNTERQRDDAAASRNHRSNVHTGLTVPLSRRARVGAR